MINKLKKIQVPKLSPSRITAIAEQVKNGTITLPELELPTDKDWLAVWALVDSCSSVHVMYVEIT